MGNMGKYVILLVAVLSISLVSTQDVWAITTGPDEVSPPAPCPDPGNPDPEDMRCWTEETLTPPITIILGMAHWVVADDGSEVNQIENGQPTFFFSPFSAFHETITIVNEDCTNGVDDDGDGLIDCDDPDCTNFTGGGILGGN